jgi:hypothetical protein
MARVVRHVDRGGGEQRVERADHGERERRAEHRCPVRCEEIAPSPRRERHERVGRGEGEMQLAELRA